MIILIAYIMSETQQGIDGRSIFFWAATPLIVTVVCMTIIAFKMKSLLEVKEEEKDTEKGKQK